MAELKILSQEEQTSEDEPRKIPAGEYSLELDQDELETIFMIMNCIGGGRNSKRYYTDCIREAIDSKFDDLGFGTPERLLDEDYSNIVMFTNCSLEIHV